MSGERLTRAELGWLLAQEARGAASALRAEVKELRASIRPPGAAKPNPLSNAESEAELLTGPGVTAPGPTARQKALDPFVGSMPQIRWTTPSEPADLKSEEPSPASEDRISALPGERHLNALDEAIDLLATLQHAGPKQKRRGRIDLAALLYDLAPNCKLSIEPGAGTEVIGDEHELRRMFHLLLHQHTGGGSGDGATLNTIEIRRQDQWIHVSVELGPDTAATSDLERRWLSRMAVKHGGRLELHGRRQRVVLPAESSNQDEVDQLKRELEQAQLLGEAYAKELATALSNESSIPPGAGPASMATGALPATASVTLTVLAAALMPTLKAVAREAHAGGPLTGGTLEAVETLRAQLQCALDPIESPRKVELREVAQRAAETGSNRGSKRGVRVLFDATPDAAPTTQRGEFVHLTTSPKALGSLLTVLVDHAISATPTGGSVHLALSLTESSRIELKVTDQGTAVPESLVDGLIGGTVDPASLGRPSGPALLIAAHLAQRLGAGISMTSQTEHTSVVLTLPRNV